MKPDQELLNVKQQFQSVGKYFYYVGVRFQYKNFGTPKCKITAYVIELRKDKDYISPDLLLYNGVKAITKKQLKNDKEGLQDWLNKLNKQYNTDVKRIIVD